MIPGLSGRIPVFFILTTKEKLKALSRELCQREPRLPAVWQCSGAAVYGVYGADWRLLAVGAGIFDSIGALRLSISPASFLQVNSRMTPLMYGLVDRLAGLSGNEEVLDLYSGVGGIGLWLAGHADQITSIESYDTLKNVFKRGQ